MMHSQRHMFACFRTGNRLRGMLCRLRVVQARYMSERMREACVIRGSQPRANGKRLKDIWKGIQWWRDVRGVCVCGERIRARGGLEGRRVVPRFKGCCSLSNADMCVCGRGARCGRVKCSLMHRSPLLVSQPLACLVKRIRASCMYVGRFPSPVSQPFACRGPAVLPTGVLLY